MMLRIKGPRGDYTLVCKFFLVCRQWWRLSYESANIEEYETANQRATILANFSIDGSCRHWY